MLLTITLPILVINLLKIYLMHVLKLPGEYLGDPVCDSFYIYPISTIEIENVISNLNTRKSTGPFSIPANILKILKTVISKPLEILYNTSISSGVVPYHLKLAKVIPLFKKGSRSSLNNYRPISILSIFNKILEKIMCNRLLNFLEKHRIIYSKQLGFRAHHATDHAILSITDKIQRAIDDQEYSCGFS